MHILKKMTLKIQVTIMQFKYLPKAFYKEGVVDFQRHFVNLPPNPENRIESTIYVDYIFLFVRFYQQEYNIITRF